MMIMMIKLIMMIVVFMMIMMVMMIILPVVGVVVSWRNVTFVLKGLRSSNVELSVITIMINVYHNKGYIIGMLVGLRERMSSKSWFE